MTARSFNQAQYDKAIDTVARNVIACMAQQAEWEDWPDIGEYDWEAINERINLLAPYPPPVEYAAAYKFLEGRCEP